MLAAAFVSVCILFLSNEPSRTLWSPTSVCVFLCIQLYVHSTNVHITNNERLALFWEVLSG